MERSFLLVVLLLCGGFTIQAQDTLSPKPADTIRHKLLKEVEVVRPTYQREAGKLVMTIAGNKLFKTAANAMDVLKKLPGLEVGGDGSLLLSGRVTPAVFIDGKPMNMSAEEWQHYLTNLSPDMIAAIEVINNPSSQYDGEYKGIINIKLKPDMTLGWKGMVSTSLQQNNYRQADNNGLFTYKTKKLAYTARVGYTTGTTVRRYNALQHLANANIMATNTKMVTHNNNYSIQLGMEYVVKKDQQLELLLRTSHINRTMNSFNTLHATDSLAKQVAFSTTSNNDADPEQHNYAANLNYTARWGRTQLQVLTSLASIGNRQGEDIQNKNALTGDLLEYWQTRMKNDIFIRTAQADLSGELGKGKWRAGAKLALTATRNSLHYDTLNTANQFVTDSNRTNTFQYDENVYAGYLTYERKLNKFNLTAGLRAEHTHSIANAVTLEAVTKRNYLTWLPSLNITYDLTPNQQLNLSVSRRITRPTFPFLNPFRFYFSPLNYWIGNPLLLPSKTNALSISYSQKAFTVSATLGREKDPMTRYPEYDATTNILAYLGRNLPYNDFANIETSIPLVVNKWWCMSNNIGGYYRKDQTPYHGVTYTIPITWFTISGSQVFTLPKGFTFDVDYYYSSPAGDGLYFGRPVSYIDLSLQRSWLKGRLNTKLNYNDIFNTYRIQRIFREKSIIDNRLAHWFGLRRVVLTVSYSFGKSTYKAKQLNKNEEENRAGM
ncbi:MULTISPECIES: TonB-dependent receptor domain-containing protein [Niastella]|uniref:TonB-dependent receptor n=1 Tax=Niastella soli TaxID=2821487 RepID=A0ABS3YYH2_9BACT|nr:TonB-dependent receptor [Niastella soli]MBO9202972.1 TonB-dependent receptor [Niastella soli]